jgi:hypothetical protein
MQSLYICYRDTDLPYVSLYPAWKKKYRKLVHWRTDNMLLLIYIPLLFCFFLLAMLSSVISSVSQFITR